MTAPLWIMGPSLPTARPPSTERVTPTALQTRVLIRTTRGTLVILIFNKILEWMFKHKYFR